MRFFVQVDKETKRVDGYSSSKTEIDKFIEIEIDSSEHEELIQSPTIFIYNEVDNLFIKDEEYKKQLIKEEEDRLTIDKKIEYLTKQLADEKLISMKKDLIINMIIQQQAQNKIEIIKLKEGN
ncbi:hypothetical protein K5V21_06050 [Clostridium sardiniense]|uniref:Uncharacterized protein n=1 Tax=Clostridium sardiniense TaxID=29369 RepID=A0ABS7KW28_CLOSR|nr:hypothetical protein [Clostridium sardiniense]MBY0755016.1 hypothetical protein [Clostridium sardiniense]MDQ0459130.1 phosphoribosylformylglycinamidine (FGAM) synthase PurS component [Clostridium sardiniense]